MLIGEVSERSGVSARMLRHYDRVGLLSPTGRTPGGYREYSEADIRRLLGVEMLRSLGLGLKEIAAALDDRAFDPAAIVDGLIAQTRENLERQTKLLHDLTRVRASEPDGWSDVLHTIALIRGLGAESASERQRVALSLGMEERKDPGPLVEAALSELDPNAAGAMDWAVARAGEAAVPALIDALDSPVDRRRRRAAEILGRIGSPTAREALARAIDHPDPVVRGRAALVRGQQGDADAVPALVELVVTGHHDVEAADLLAALATRQDCAEGVVRIIRAKVATSGPAERLRLTAALSDLPVPSATTLLSTLTADPDQRVALTAVALLRSRSAAGAS